VFEATPPPVKYTHSVLRFATPRDQVNVPSALTSLVAPVVKGSPREVRVCTVTMPPIPKPVVDPTTSTARPARVPVITMEGRTSARGVTALLGAEAADQPAALRALAVNLYDVPFVSPETVHVVAATRHTRPPGDDTTSYVDVA